jgi:hypothetical protein
MSTVIAQDINEGSLYLNFEVDLSAAAAITATRGTGVTASKTGTGQYTFTIKGGTRGIKLVETLMRTCDLSGTPATAFWGKVTSGPTQTSGGTNDGDITVVVTTLSNAATPVAADTTGACTLSVAMCLRTVRDPAVAVI